jgi:hypothetical protein
MATKDHLKDINDAARKENRPNTIDPAIIDALPDDATNYMPTGHLQGPGGTWHYMFDLPGGGQVDLTVTGAERQQHGI